jgi:glutamyl-tRNA synthetase
VWLNAEMIRTMPLDELSTQLQPFVPDVEPVRIRQIAPLIQERIKLLGEIKTVADFFFADALAPYDPAELVPQKGDAAMAASVLASAEEILATASFNHDGLDQALRAGAEALKVKAGQMFQPIRVAVCGRKNAPPLFETLEVLGREVCLQRIAAARRLLKETA